MRLTDTQRQLANILYAEPGMTRESLIKRVYPSYHSQNIKQSLDSLIRQELVTIEPDGTIKLSLLLEEVAESAATRERKKGALVKPAEPPTFRPLSAKFIPSARGTRDGEPAREFHPHSLVSNVPVSVAGY